MDCVRTVLRMGSERSVMTYRRSIQEIPVDEIELEEAEIEGVEIMYMVSPTRVIGDENGNVIGIEMMRNELGEPDASGRRRPNPVKGSEFIIDCDMVIVAIGQKQDNRFLGDMFAKRDRRGVPLLDQNLRTELDNVWAAGDYVINPTNFISSIGEGKRVADLIDIELRGAEPKIKDMEITRVPTEYVSHAESAALGRRRRVVADRDEPPPGLGRRLRRCWPPGDADAPGAAARHGHFRQHARNRKSATPSQSGSRKPSAACSASSTSSSMATAAFSATAASMSARTSASK